MTEINHIECLDLEETNAAFKPESITREYIDMHYTIYAVDKTTLTKFIIPDSVTEIESHTFSKCTSLTSIVIPNNVTMIHNDSFNERTSLKRISCNNPDLFTYDNFNNFDQIQFISIGEHLKTNYPDLLRAIDPPSLSNYSESSGFNYNHVSSKELNLIVKLHQKDYIPDWKTIATTFKERSID